MTTPVQTYMSKRSHTHSMQQFQQLQEDKTTQLQLIDNQLMDCILTPIPLLQHFQVSQGKQKS